MTIHIAIIFGGKSSEHRESIKSTKLLYKHIKSLPDKYELHFFYMTRNSQWTTKQMSYSMIKGDLPMDSEFTKNISSKYYDNNRILELKKMNAIYNTMMGDSGENGNIMGLADLLGVPMIGCGILASALCADKHLSKILAKTSGVKIVDFILIDKRKQNDIKEIASNIEYPCFVKPTNLGTCSYVFRAENEKQFIENFTKILKKNDRSDQYLIEKFIDDMSEVRIFIYEDINGNLHANDLYVTQLNIKHLEGEKISLFKSLNNNFSSSTRKKIIDYAKKMFKIFKLKDYARVDFFVKNQNNEIYFNEINTQPFISNKNIKFMENDGLTYIKFFETMIKRNVS